MAFFLLLFFFTPSSKSAHKQTVFVPETKQNTDIFISREADKKSLVQINI